MVESKIERTVVKWCRDRGLICVKMTPVGQTGWPDRLIILPHGKALWIEFKRPGGIVRPKQLWVHELLRKFGHQVEVCDDEIEAERLISVAFKEASSW